MKTTALGCVNVPAWAKCDALSCPSCPPDSCPPWQPSFGCSLSVLLTAWHPNLHTELELRLPQHGAGQAVLDLVCAQKVSRAVLFPGSDTCELGCSCCDHLGLSPPSSLCSWRSISPAGMPRRWAGPALAAAALLIAITSQTRLVCSVCSEEGAKANNVIIMRFHSR